MLDTLTDDELISQVDNDASATDTERELADRLQRYLDEFARAELVRAKQFEAVDDLLPL